MAKIRPVGKAMLFIGSLYSDQEYYFRAYSELKDEFGDVVMESPQSEWNFSDYYTEELGSPIFRRFLFFREPFDQGKLAEAKLKTIDIEDRLSLNGRRRVNLDPGYITPAKVVLASTKDYSHRIYLRDGIYAEVTLIFRDDRFHPHLHTYRDYKDEDRQKLFLLARDMFFLLKMNE